MRQYPILLLLPLLLWTCGSDDDTVVEQESFDRAAMLEHWADNLIIPAYTDFATTSSAFVQRAQDYATEGSPETLARLRADYEQLALEWQRVSPFMTGPGENLRLREQVNIYPTDTATLLAEPTIDLALPSAVDVQGLPALDYLLFGVQDPADHRDHIARLAQRVNTLAETALNQWRDTYRAEYVTASGNSATASVDRTVNDYLFWYEKHLRAGKVGIPAGVFSSAPDASLTEAPFHGGLSKRLFLEGLQTAERFFGSEPSLKDYLDALGVRRDDQLLSERIEANFANARQLAGDLDENFATQVRDDNPAMLTLYDALQANVILLKVDMLQALGINVDFVDADGD